MPQKGTYTALQKLKPIETDFGAIAKEEQNAHIKNRALEKAEKDKNGKWKETHEDDNAAAFRYMAMYLNDMPTKKALKDDPFKRPYRGSSGWMGS